MTASIIPLNDNAQDQRPKESEKPDVNLFQGLPVGIPRMPANMDEVAQRHWLHIGKQLVDLGLLSHVDIGQFRILCETYAHYVRAENDCRAQGEYQETPNGYEQLAPWAVARERHANRYQKVAEKFFLSPKARTQIKLENPNQDTLDLE
jgi:P27 family predicted phage terminase small subunit